MQQETYLEICSVLERSRSAPVGHTLADLSARLQVPYGTLRGIYALIVKKRVKSSTNDHKKRRHEYLDRYCAVADQEARDTMLTLAEEVDMQPFLFARLLVLACHERIEEKIAKGQISPDTVHKKSLNSAVKQTIALMDHSGTAPVEFTQLGIDTKHMALHVKTCAECDDSYGPLNDRLRRTVGLEYEFKLNETLRNRDIPYITEDMLRMTHCAKTPDAVLPYPLEVDGVLVYWIDSKACFGDKQTMVTSFRDQFHAYLNRYKTGLVIYWFSYVVDAADEDGELYLDTWKRDGVLIRSSFPEDAVLRNDLPANVLPGI